MKEVFGLYH